MRKRDIQIIVHLYHNEREHLRKLVKKSGLSQEAYLRHLINGFIPTDAPPPDYFAMMKQLRHIGVNLKGYISCSARTSASSRISHGKRGCWLSTALTPLTSYLPTRMGCNYKSTRFMNRGNTCAISHGASAMMSGLRN